MASMTNDEVHGVVVVRASMFSAQLEARCNLAMAMVLEHINPEYSNEQAIWAWERAHEVGFTYADEAMPLMFKGHKTLEDGFTCGQEWAYLAERAEALAPLED